jgi:hypothetical protein
VALGTTDGIEVVDEAGALLMHNRAAIALGVQHGRTTIEGAQRASGCSEPTQPTAP